MYKRHILGKQGEEIAIYYLNKKGYKILEKNFLCRQGEIDVIALDDNYIVFIEICKLLKPRVTNIPINISIQ